MAWTTTKQHATVYGNKRVETWLVSPDSSTVTALQTGLQKIDHFTVAVLTATATSTFGTHNVGASNTAIGGSIKFSSASAGGDVLVTVYGR